MPENFPPEVPRYFKRREFVEDKIEARTAVEDATTGFHVVIEGTSYFIPHGVATRFARFVLFEGERDTEQ